MNFPDLKLMQYYIPLYTSLTVMEAYIHYTGMTVLRIIYIKLKIQFFLSNLFSEISQLNMAVLTTVVVTDPQGSVSIILMNLYKLFFQLNGTPF